MRYGSIQNQFAGQDQSVVPVVGMGVTVIGWTDRHAGTITRVSPSKKTIWYKRDKATRIDKNGMTDSGQKYEFSPDPTAKEETARAVKRHVRLDGVEMDAIFFMHHGQKILVGQRSEYYDFSF
jgi:hypothetical protein